MAERHVRTGNRCVLRQRQLVRSMDEDDASLLARFAATRDAAAFAALVRRHGPLVFGLCRRTLGHVHDAEDAFQATFLVLARRAGTIVRRDRLASWLYGVAVRTAQVARRRMARIPCSRSSIG